MSTFYGHLMPSPIPHFAENQFMPLAQYHSNHCILVNLRGRRFCDESQGDEVSNQALLPQPSARGVLLCDQRVRTTYVVAEPFPNAGGIDRFAEAVAAGAHFTSANTRIAVKAGSMPSSWSCSAGSATGSRSMRPIRWPTPTAMRPTAATAPSVSSNTIRTTSRRIGGRIRMS